MCVCRCVDAMVCMWRSECNLWESSVFYCVGSGVQGIKLTLSDLIPRALNCWIPAPNLFLNVSTLWMNLYMKIPASQRTGSVPQHPGSVSSGYCKPLGFSSEAAKNGYPAMTTALLSVLKTCERNSLVCLNWSSLAGSLSDLQVSIFVPVGSA